MTQANLCACILLRQQETQRLLSEDLTALCQLIRSWGYKNVKLILWSSTAVVSLGRNGPSGRNVHNDNGGWTSGRYCNRKTSQRWPRARGLLIFYFKRLDYATNAHKWWFEGIKGGILLSRDIVDRDPRDYPNGAMWKDTLWRQFRFSQLYVDFQSRLRVVEEEQSRIGFSRNVKIERVFSAIQRF